MQMTFRPICVIFANQNYKIMETGKPYIICHMMQSLDGRIACDMVDKISGDEYYDALDILDCQANIEGKHSYQIHSCGFEEFKTDNPQAVDHEEYYLSSHHDSYSVSVDTRGTLLWDNGIDDNHICIVSQCASRQYLDYLRSLSISYIATGREQIDLTRAMEILHDKFGVRRVAVVGGGKINGSFLAAGLIDEISSMIAPGIDGRVGQPALFDGLTDKEGYLPVQLRFKGVETFPNGVIWARYDVKK